MNVDNSDAFYNLDGLISDSMGHLRDGNYQLAENVLEIEAMHIIETLPQPDKRLEQIKILRKLSVIYEYQDRVDECHDAWARANDLEKKPKFGANPHPGWNLSPPPSASGPRLRGMLNILTREQLTEDVHEAEKRVEEEQVLYDTHVAANERYIASILTMAREDQVYADVRRVLTAATSKNLKTAPTHVPSPSSSSSSPRTSTVGSEHTGHFTPGKNNDRRQSKLGSPSSATASSPSAPTTTSSATHSEKREKPQRSGSQVVAAAAQRSKKRTRKKKGRDRGGRASGSGSSGKTQTIDELKKLIKSDPSIAGACALKMARKYTKIRQPKKALQAYRTALSKEKRNFENVGIDQKELEENWSKLRGLKEKREAEELKIQLALDWVKSERIIVASHLGLSKLLLNSPIAALDAEVVVATMPSQIEAARSWFPHAPKSDTHLKSIYCAAPLIEEQCRQWCARYPIRKHGIMDSTCQNCVAGTECPIKRRNMLRQTIDFLNGCVTGPLGDLFGEMIEELLETVEDGDDLILLDLAGTFYTRRRHFRRANEIIVRSEALRRGETRSFAETRRRIGEELLTFGKHLDPSIGLYLSSMPASISGKTSIVNATVNGQKNTTKSIERMKNNLIQHGESGTFGVAMSDTWRGNLVNLVNPNVHSSSQDALIGRTTVGRSRDERSDNKYLLRSVGVSGQLVPTAGSSSLILKLQKGDLKSSNIPRGRIKGGGPEVKWRDELEEQRRRKGHADMWHHHASKMINQVPQGEISTSPYDPEGIPKRHWLEPSRAEREARAKILEAAGTAGDMPPPTSAAVIATKLNTAESRRLSTSTLAKKFGSAGLGETQRLQNVSRARVFELPPPVRNPLQTPGTRSTLGSRGGMAFWMDDMPTLEVDIKAGSFPDASTLSSVEGGKSTSNAQKRKSFGGKQQERKQPATNLEDQPGSNALDFLERPPSTSTTSSLPHLSRLGTARSLDTAGSIMG